MSKLLNTVSRFFKTDANDAVVVAVSTLAADLETALAATVPTDFEPLGDVAVGLTEVAVPFSGATTKVRIRFDVNGSGILFIGKTGVLADGSNDLVRLEPGDEWIEDYNNADNPLYVISDTAAQTFNASAFIPA